MRTILIVDDETIYRKGLRKMITAWQEDWAVAGEARDGYEALDMIELLRPDVVLTDIRMPRMDGIQLQKIVRERFPDIIVIVISGYDEFYYVQQSLRQGARDYIMKPFEKEELHKILTQVKTELDLRPEHAASAPEKLQEDQFLQKQMSRSLLTGLLHGNLQEEEFRRLQDLVLGTSHPCYACLVIKLDKASVGPVRYNKANPSLFQLYIQQVAQEMLSGQFHAVTVVLSDTEVAALIGLPDAKASKGRLLDKIESIRLAIKSLSSITVTIGLGKIADSLRTVSKAYQEAEIALLHRLIVGGDKILDYEVFNKDEPGNGLAKWSWEALEEPIHKGDKEETLRRLDEAIHELCKHAAAPEAVHQQICKLLIHSYEVAEAFGITKRWLDKDIRHVLVDICSISSREELVEECRRLLGELTAFISESAQNQDPVEKTLRYLERHFSEQVTLKEVADHVYLNPAYLSTLLRQKTGITFVEHLNQLRVEEAKRRLLLTDEKVAVIGEQTGFSNIRHFNRVFKLFTGMAPKDFREKAGGKVS